MYYLLVVSLSRASLFGLKQHSMWVMAYDEILLAALVLHHELLIRY